MSRRTSHSNHDRRLPPKDAFVRHTAARPAPPAQPNAENLTGGIVGRHCAGMRGRASGRDVLAALQAPGSGSEATEQTIDWLFGTIETHECIVLMARCGVTIEAMAHYARRRRPLRAKLCRFLTQFAIDDEGLAWRWPKPRPRTRFGPKEEAAGAPPERRIGK